MLLRKLQMFAEEGEGKEPEGKEPEGKKNEQKEPEKKYTDADVDRLINEKFAKWQEKAEKERAEAEKLAKMNAEQKANFEKEKVEKELADLKRQVALNDMSREARRMLAEEKIVLPDGIISTLVSDDAESTKSRVEEFAKLYQKAVENGVKEALAGHEPKAGEQATLTREQILAVKDRAERQKLMAENSDLFVMKG